MIKDAILYSYRRPEMTARAIQRLLKWDSRIRIHVSIDGLRSNAPVEEIAWRNETILQTERLAEANSNVIPHVWHINDGLTAHGIRIFDKVFESSHSTFSLEEDNLVSEEGFDFLAHSSASGTSAGIASAYTSLEHTLVTQTSRFTLFPEQWATALNLPIYEKFREVWFSKKIDKEVTSKILSEHFKGDWVYRKLVTEKWHRVFLASVQDKSYGDALMTYVAFSLGIPYQVPMKSYVTDLGAEDLRGLHPRLDHIESSPHIFSAHTLLGKSFCTTCERLSSGIPGTGLVHVAKYIKRRTSSALGFSELQPQK